MTDLAAELTAKLVKPNSFTMGSAPFHVIELAAFVYANAPTILAGLAALEVVNNLRVRLSAVQFNYASELGIQAESLMQLEQSLGESFDSLGDAIASAVAALEERDKLRALCDQAAAMVDSLAYGSYAENSQVGRLVQRLKAAALQPTPETTKEK